MFRCFFWLVLRNECHAYCSPVIQLSVQLFVGTLFLYLFELTVKCCAKMDEGKAGRYSFSLLLKTICILPEVCIEASTESDNNECADDVECTPAFTD